MRRPSPRLCEFVVCAFALGVCSAMAGVRCDVDIGELVAAADRKGLSETNGWSMFCMTNYSQSCLKFYRKGSFLLSPKLASPILRLQCRVRCSSLTPTRLLYVCDGDSGLTNATFSVCSAKNRLEEQTLDFDASLDMRRMRFVLQGSGNAGVWGIASLALVLADASAPPAAIRLERATATQATICWSNDLHCVSNLIDLFSVPERESESRTLVASTIISATPGWCRFSTRGWVGLRPSGRWLAEVRGVTSEGVVSEPASVCFSTKPQGGMAIFAR